MNNNKNHPIDIHDLWAAVRRHPDYRGGVIWVRGDIESVASEYGVDPDALDTATDFKVWEDMATENGFLFTLNEAAAEIKNG